MSGNPKENPKLLIVSYYFLRTQSSGGHRLHAITKYLSRRGWEVTVLTVARDSPRGKPLDDQTVRKYIPMETKVIRTRSLEFERLRAYVSRNKGEGSSDSGRDSAAEVGGRRGGATDRLRSLLKAPGRWVNSVVSFPDRQIGWFFPLLFGGWRLIRKQRFDVVLTSGPPHSCHLPFVLLKTMLHFTWVADFRDPWTNPPFYAIHAISLSKRPFSLLLNRLLERRVLVSCDRIVANTPGNEEALREAFPNIDREKTAVITNGFDDEIVGAPGSLDDSALDCDFVFTGAMYRRMLNVYLEALEVLRSNGKQRIPVLHIFGDEDDELKTKVREDGFERSIVFKGSVSYEESLWVLKHANALLLLFIGHDEVYRRSVPSKLYAYLFSGTPYFALVPDGDAAKILERVGGGVVVKSLEPREMAAKMVSFLESKSKETGEFGRNLDVLSDYSWSMLSSKFDRLLREGRGDLRDGETPYC